VRIEWFGQSSFKLEADGKAVFVDPFADMQPLRDRGRRWDYPEIEGVDADLVLVTHEHVDHNGVEVIGGEPAVIRSTAGTLDSPLGAVTAVASEHDASAGTERGPNSIMVFELGGVRVCHFGDFGQHGLRAEQREAIGAADLLIVPVGGGPTIDAAEALRIAAALDPKWVVPMHYRTEAIDFLDPLDQFAAGFPDERRHRAGGPAVELGEIPAGNEPALVILDPPLS
jgi:L-ascorbate metabolism protein UlaG (beta-lactamase superfamily)